jgi:ketosteroid isomerase-like protein
MSQENVEIVSRYFDLATKRIDAYWQNPRPIADAMQAGELDAESNEMLSYMHADVRWTNALGIVFQGQLDCARGVDQLLEASQTYSVAIEEVIDLGGDHVLAVLRVGLRGKTSGASASQSLFSVNTLQEGLIVRADEYLDRAQALQAVGLAE